MPEKSLRPGLVHVWAMQATKLRERPQIWAGTYESGSAWGAKTDHATSWQPETRVNRAVLISAALRTFLDWYRAPKFGHGWFFPNLWGTRYDPDDFSQDLRAANQEAGLQWTRLHYRHTFGRQLAMKGESLYKISKLMGNSPEICRWHYAAIYPEYLVDGVDFTTPAPKLRRVSAG